jgi:hypothetical protein
MSDTWESTEIDIDYDRLKGSRMVTIGYNKILVIGGFLSEDSCT